jgi:nitronate monooxygenase
VGGVVYHDVTERKWAEKGIAAGVDGLVAVNARAGGHAGSRSPEALFDELAAFGKPIVSAGGVGTPDEFARQLRLGYAAVQLGTRFIATPECRASDAYKKAIVAAGEDDIVHTLRLTGVPVAVIRNAYVERLGTQAGWLARRLLKGRKTKHWMRTWYALSSIRRLKRSLLTDDTSNEYWQAGKSVAGIHEVKPAAQIVREFAAALNG